MHPAGRSVATFQFTRNSWRQGQIQNSHALGNSRWGEGRTGASTNDFTKIYESHMKWRKGSAYQGHPRSYVNGLLPMIHGAGVRGTPLHPRSRSTLFHPTEGSRGYSCYIELGGRRYPCLLPSMSSNSVFRAFCKHHMLPSVCRVTLTTSYNLQQRLPLGKQCAVVRIQ